MGHLQGPWAGWMQRHTCLAGCQHAGVAAAVTAGHTQAVQGDASPTCTALEA